MPIPFDELFAIRFQLQDYTLDEFIIIKRLKIILLNDNMNLEEVNNYLVEFYNNFGLNLSLEEIQAINVNPSSLVSMYVNLINPPNLSTIPENTGDPVDNNSQNSSDNEDNHDNNGISPNENPEDDINNPNINHPPPLNLFNIPIINNFTPINNIYNNNDVNIEDTNEDENSQNNNEPVVSNYSNIFTIPLNSNLNNSLLPQLENIISNQPVLPQEFNLFTNLINNITTNNFYNNNLQQAPEYEEDVLVTLDDKDLDDLETCKATGNEDRCTICLCDIEKDEDIINLKCSHTFHDECLRQYLKDYDFKCPICREEVGKSKAHV